LDQDVKPRGGNAYSTRKGGKGKSKGKGRGRGHGKGKGKGKDYGKGRSLADDDEFEQPLKRSRLHERKAQTVEYIEPTADSEDNLESDTRSQTSHRSHQSSSNPTVLRVHATNSPKDQQTSDTNPDEKIYHYCAYHGFNFSHHGGQWRAVRGKLYSYQQKQARLPSDCSPRGNDAVEPQRQSTFLKAWGKYH
jgi:hypothetical protein